MEASYLVQVTDWLGQSQLARGPEFFRDKISAYFGSVSASSVAGLGSWSQCMTEIGEAHTDITEAGWMSVVCWYLVAVTSGYSY